MNAPSHSGGRRGLDRSRTEQTAQRIASRPPYIQAVERAVSLLVKLAELPDGVSLQTLANEIGCSKSTVFRLVSTLERLEVVEKDSQQRCWLGPRLWNLSRDSWSRKDLRRLALPYLSELRDASEETVTLSLVDPRGAAHYVVEQVESAHEIRRVQPIGQPVPLVRGSTAKVVLAFLPLDEAARMVAVHAPSGNASPNADELEQIRSRGYCLSLGERISGGTAISAPILDQRGRPTATLGIAGPSSRFTPDRALACVPRLLASVKAISSALGYSGSWPPAAV